MNEIAIRNEYTQYITRKEINCAGPHIVLKFPNEYGASIILEDSCPMFEIAVLKNGLLCYDTYLTDDVLRFQTANDVLDVLDKIFALTRG